MFGDAIHQLANREAKRTRYELRLLSVPLSFPQARLALRVERLLCSSIAPEDFLIDDIPGLRAIRVGVVRR
jgi:hypothetical protein